MASGWRKYDGRKYPRCERERFGQLLCAARTDLGLSFGDLSRLTGNAAVRPSTLKLAETAQRDLPETSEKPHRSRVIAALEAEARRQGKPVDSAALRVAGGLLRPTPGPSLSLSPPPADKVDAVADEQTPADYDGLMAQAWAASDAFNYNAAAQLYAQAADAATRDGRITHEAMALSRLAYTLRRLNAFSQAKTQARKALDRLNLTAFDPATDFDIAEFKPRVTDEPVLEAYATAARALGHVAVDLEDLPTATTIFTTLSRIGETLGHSTLRANAELFLGRLLVLEGCDAGADEQWFQIVNRGKIEAGRRRIREAKTLRRDADRLWEAHRLAQEVRAALFLEGKKKQTATLVAEAKDAFGESQAIANLYLAQAQFGLAVGSEAVQTEGLFTQVLQLGWDIHSDLLLSSALAGLAELSSLMPDRSEKRWKQAVAYCLAALGMWPSSAEAREYRRIVRQFKYLDVPAHEVKDALALMRQRTLLEAIGQLPGFNDRLRKRLERLNHDRYHGVLETALPKPPCGPVRQDPPVLSPAFLGRSPDRATRLAAADA